jgi:dihydrodipicolinate synthase/N-acetylneuraminate lyase
MSLTDTRRWLCGPLVAVATPFRDDFSLDLPGLVANIEAMIDRGIRTGDGALLVGGAAGEFPTLSNLERRDVMRASVAAAAGRVPVMTSIQDTDTREIIDLVRFAANAGIAGVQLGATYYYPSTEADLLRLVEQVGRVSEIPLMVYSTWWEGGVTMGPALLLRLAEIEHVEALKWSAPDFDGFTAGLAAIADRLVVIDNQAMHVWGHLLGARGFVTHVGNFWPEYAVELWRELERGDYPAATRRLASFKWAWGDFAGRVAATSGGEGPFIKAALDVVGLHGGPPRPPSARVGGALLDELRHLFHATGVPGAGQPLRRPVSPAGVA